MYSIVENPKLISKHSIEEESSVNELIYYTPSEKIEENLEKKQIITTIDNHFIPFAMKNSFEKIFSYNLDSLHKTNSPKLKSINENNKEVNQILSDYKKYYNKIDNGKIMPNASKRKMLVSKSHNLL